MTTSNNADTVTTKLQRIEKLTPAQEEMIPVYAAKGTRWGMSCDPIDEDAARSYASRIQPWLDRKYAGTVIVDSPYAADRMAHAFAVLENCIDKVVEKYAARTDRRPDEPDPADLTHSHELMLTLLEYTNAPNARVLNRLRRDAYEVVLRVHRERGLTGPALKAAAMAEGKLIEPDKFAEIKRGFAVTAGEALGRADTHAMCAGMADDIVAEAAMGMRFEAFLKEAAEVTKDAALVWPYLEGQWSSYFVAWYLFYVEVLGLHLESIWQIQDQIQFGCVYPLARYVIISRRPECIRLNATGQLHCATGPAVRYADGFSVYSMNGVRVPAWLADTRDTDIDPARFATLTNAEVRREFIRKVGIERVVTSCGCQTLDKSKDGVYELILVDLKGTTGKVPYLKMLNPSIGVWHLEGVDPKIRTVKAALAWRNQSDLKPSQLT